MFTRKNIAVLVAAAGLGTAGAVIADDAKREGCAGERHASAGEHRHGQGMERMQERHARMAERHARHGAGQAKPEGKAEEHKH
jgi:hypothetical protein